MATCTGERPLQCNHCDKDFQDNSQLKIHVNNHTGEKPYRCSHCGKAFARKIILKYMCWFTLERMHTYKRRYCDKAFARKNHFKIHVLDHTGENAY